MKATIFFVSSRADLSQFDALGKISGAPVVQFSKSHIQFTHIHMPK